MNSSPFNGPDFIIVGAPRCGTTAMHAYLSGHPQIFMPVFKEPHYFAPDLYEGRRFVKTWEHYEALFRRAHAKQLCTGEASVFYLYSREAPRLLAKQLPHVRLVAMLRDPVQVAHSFFFTQRRVFEEDLDDFQEAWELQEARARGQRLPKTCKSPSFLQYRKLVRFGEQIDRMLNSFPKEQLRIIFFEDFVADSKKVYEEILEHLGVASDGRIDFPRINEDVDLQHSMLAKMLYRPPRWIAPAIEGIKNLFVNQRDRIAEFVTSKLGRKLKRPPLDADFVRRIRAELSDDIRLLESLVDKDLSAWRNGPDAASN